MVDPTPVAKPMLTPCARVPSPFCIQLFLRRLSTEQLPLVDIPGNVGCLRIWRGRGDDGSVFMHACHFAFAFGSVIGPLLAAPFLTEREEQFTIGDLIAGNNVTSLAANRTVDGERERPRGVIHLFILVGCIVFLTGKIFPCT